MKIVAFAFAAACISIPVNARSADVRPDWMSPGQLSVLSKLGIDPARDIEVKGNYHWRWRARQKLVAGAYSCPAGSAVDISRSITLIVAAETGRCADRKGGGFSTLKIRPDGSAEPLPQ